MKQLQHDTSIGAARAIMGELKDDIPGERRLPVMHLLYYSIRAALEKYEELVERRDDLLYRRYERPGSN